MYEKLASPANLCALSHISCCKQYEQNRPIGACPKTPSFTDLAAVRDGISGRFYGNSGGFSSLSVCFFGFSTRVSMQLETRNRALSMPLSVPAG